MILSAATTGSEAAGGSDMDVLKCRKKRNEDYQKGYD